MSLFEKNENLKDKKSLVIYFSHTGENYMSDGIRNIEKGNTEIVAEMIKEITGADLFKVEPINKYPYNYKECCDVAKVELNQNARPKLKNYLENIDEYEVIYIGYPIWWGEPPMPLFTELEKLDFTGKIVKPFSTHEGSGLGSSEKSIKSVCKGADIRRGLAIRGTDARKESSKETIQQWLNDLKF